MVYFKPFSTESLGRIDGHIVQILYPDFGHKPEMDPSVQHLFGSRTSAMFNTREYRTVAFESPLDIMSIMDIERYKIPQRRTQQDERIAGTS
jgi:hypothetical protein